jgi:hypothetical protein
VKRKLDIFAVEAKSNRTIVRRECALDAGTAPHDRVACDCIGLIQVEQMSV